jgi:hypothetical protein
LNDVQYGKTVATLFTGRSSRGNRDLGPGGVSPLPFRVRVDSDRFSTLASSYAIREQEMQEALRAAAFTALLMAPQFLFRAELGAPGASARKLTPFELAAALSYALTDGPPDQALWEAARAGALATPAILAQHVAQLLEAPADLGPVREFFAEWFQYPRARAVDKPGSYDPDSLVRETDLYVADVLGTDARKNLLGALLTERGQGDLVGDGLPPVVPNLVLDAGHRAPGRRGGRQAADARAGHGPGRAGG